MEVILNKDLDRIGKAGQIIEVKDGFARNFLIPNGLALPVNSENLKRIEQQREKKISALEKAKNDAFALKEKLTSLSLTIPVLTQGEDKLYGSITNVELENVLREEGLDIDKNKIALDEPIRSLGIYEVPIKLHPEVTAQIKVWIVKK